MFEKTKELMDKFETTINKTDDWDDKDLEFMDESSMQFAKVLYREIPSITYVVKHIQLLLEENGGEYDVSEE